MAVVPTSMPEPHPKDLNCPSEPTVVAWGLSALDQGIHQSKTRSKFGLVACRLKGVSGTSEMVAPSSAAQTRTSRLKVVGVNKLE